MKQIFFAIALLIFISSCKKEDNNDTVIIKGELAVLFDNIAGSSDLALNTGFYKTAGGDSFNVTKLKYYVSNFVLTKIDGTIYAIPQDSSYFLIDESDNNSKAPVLHLPEGEYKTLSFLLGIDSLRSTMDLSKRTGVLDPTAAAADMYWSWNSGYIFYKMEGTSPSSTNVGNTYIYHIGYFGGYSTQTLNNIRKISIDLSLKGTSKVKSGKKSNIYLKIDVVKMFSGFNIATHATVMTDPFSANIANNFASMIKHDRTEN